MGRSAEVSKIVKEKTGGVVSFLSDYLLLLFLHGVETAFGGYGSRNAYRASERAFEEFLAIKEGRAKAQARNAVNSLRARGYIRLAEGAAKPEITELGKKRLHKIFPVYEEKRPWDGRMYVITYDIPERERAKRDDLREILKKLGCGMLQASVWIIPYNPKSVLREFVREKQLGGLVIISEVDKDGAIGGESFPSLVWKVYNLDEVEQEYKDFIELCKSGEPLPNIVLLKYLAILKNDPQLPFELLPRDWAGGRAFGICKERVGEKVLLRL